MRKLALLGGLIGFAAAGFARAQDEAPAEGPAGEPGVPPVASTPTTAAPAPAADVAASKRRMQLGAVFLPMLLGKLSASPNEYSRSTLDEPTVLSPAYGLGLSFGYNVAAGLSVGIAPQAIFHLENNDGSMDKVDAEFDLMARVAYVYAVIPNFAVYAEILPGYSVVTLTSAVAYWGKKPTTPKGLVLGFGGGWAFDVTDQFFVHFGIGYQLGFQKMSVLEYELDMKTRFLRVALGGGKKF